MVVLPTVSVDGGALDMRFYGKKQNGDMVTYAVDFYTAEGNGASERLSHRKEYTLQCYDGGFYLLSATGVNTPDRIGEIGGICLWDAWDMLPKTLTEGFTDLGVVGVSRENYDVVMYGRDGLYVHVPRLQEGKEDTERGLGDRVCDIYTTSPDYPTQRGLRVGDPESRAIELYGEDYLWYTFGYEQQDGVITRMGFFTYYDVGSEDAVIMPLPAYDLDTPLQASEFTLPHGLRFGMPYDEAYWLCGDAVSDTFTGEVGRSFTCEGYTYSFDDEDILYYVMIRSTSGESDPAPTVRGIRLGDSMDSVFDKLPCTDRELKQWAMQTVYDDGAGHSAELAFVAGSFYSLRL